MKKRGLILDSTSGISKKEAESRGIGFIPLVIKINDQNYHVGIDINETEIEKMMDKKGRKNKISTSLPNGKEIEESFDKALKEYDEIVVLTLSFKFSGTNNACRLIANQDKYKGRVFVYDSHYSSPWTYFLIDDIKEIVEHASSIERVYELLNQQNKWMVGYMGPGDIYWFYNGGRITKFQYLIGSVSKLIPILTVKNGQIDQNKIYKCRNRKKAYIKMLSLLEKTVEKAKEENLKYRIIVINSNNENIVEEQIEAVTKHFQIDKKDIIKTRLSADQTAHLGPNSIGMSLSVSYKEKR